MKQLLLLSLLCMPMVGMNNDIQQAKECAKRIKPLEHAFMISWAATQTVAAVTGAGTITKIGIPCFMAVGSALLGSDYLLTKYAKDSK